MLLKILAITLVSSWVWVIGVIGQQNPTISFITKELVVNIGDPLELQCTVFYSRDYPVVWAKIIRENPNNNLFITQGSTVNIPDGRYAVKYDHHTSTYTLLIIKAQETDAGHYQCQIITGTASRITADVYVYVRIPPIISDNSTRSVITTVGTNITLACYAAGFPQPQISWRRDRNDLLPNGMAYYRGNELVIPHITKEARGTYYCVADNGVSPGARRSIGVEIEFPPTVKIGRGRYGQALQYDADLYCHVEAFPSPSITWTKDGEALNDNQHYQISIFATSNEFTDTTLRVKRIEKKQYGYYRCKAVNKLGEREENIELFETVNVICPPACGVGYLTGSATSTRSVQTLTFTLTLTFQLFFTFYFLLMTKR